MAEYRDVTSLEKLITDLEYAVTALIPASADYLVGYISALSAVKKAINEQPAADVTPVIHGHIIRKHRNRGRFELLKGVDVKTGETRTFRYDGRYGSYDPYCSVCGKLMGEALNYCSNCGAKMNGEESNG